MDSLKMLVLAGVAVWLLLHAGRIARAIDNAMLIERRPNRREGW